jgi:hypothetical protein
MSAAARSTRGAVAPARAVAARVLERVETDAAFADLALEADLLAGSLGDEAVREALGLGPDRAG